nr:hypothetical protein [Actinomycetota bacterium]
PLRPAPTPGTTPAPGSAAARGPATGADPDTPTGSGDRQPTAAGDRPLPSRDELTKSWGDSVLPALRLGVKAYVSAGRFVAVEDGAAVFALPDAGLLSRAQDVKAEAEAALAAHFGRSIPLRLVMDQDPTPPRPHEVAKPAVTQGEEDPDAYNLAEMEDAGAAVVSPAQRLLEAFPGAEEVNP